HRDPARPQAHHRPAAGAQSQLPLHPLRFRRAHAPLAVPQLQGVGDGEATAELRSGVSVSMGVWASAPLVFVAALGTWLALRYARGRPLALPGERRGHSIPPPRGGGRAIATALLAGCIPGSVAGGVPVALGAAFATGLLMGAGIG